MTWGNLRDAWQSIRANRLRSLLAVLSILIGVGALITMLSVGAGAQDRIAAQIRSLGANVVMILPGAERAAAGSNGERARPVPLTIADAAVTAETLPDVIAAAPALQLRARVVHGNRNWPSRINGTTADYFLVRDWPITQGRGFAPRDESGARKVALLGATVAERLFGDADPLGRTVRIANTPLEVIGLLARKGQSGSGRDQDDIVFVPYLTAKLRLGGGAEDVVPNTVTYIIAKAASDNAVAAARERTERLLRARHHIAPGAPAGFRVMDPAAAMVAQRQSSRTIAWLLAAIASISLVVGGISIMNIMLVSVAERRREIGLRLALGATRGHIGWLFLTEALVICVAGGLLGVAAGAGAAWTISTLTT